MIIRIHLPNGARLAACQVDGGQRVEIETPCPRCSATPCKLRGAGDYAETHDTMAVDAKASCCGAIVGRLVVTVDTIFGIAEDRAVLCGRPRVY